MKLDEVMTLARTLMNEHGLEHIPLTLSRARKALGAARFRNNVPVELRLSKHYMAVLPEEQVRDTILHEIAHLLTPGDGHGRKWKAMCRKIGAVPERCVTTELTAEERTFHRYAVVCSGCGKHLGYNSRRWKGEKIHTVCGGYVKQILNGIENA